MYHSLIVSHVFIFYFYFLNSPVFFIDKHIIINLLVSLSCLIGQPSSLKHTRFFWGGGGLIQICSGRTLLRFATNIYYGIPQII